MSVPHPVLEVPDVEATISFLQSDELRQLPSPWPRCQDLRRKSFAVPTKDDLVLAVSHAWPYGAHPDPVGNKGAAIAALIDQACETHRPKGKALMFTDFLSVPQRPFALWQLERTAEQEAAFAKAMRAFPQVYLQADAVLHIDVPMHRVGGDGQEYHVRLSDLDGVKLRLLGTTVHVVGLELEHNAPDPRVLPFDILERVGDVEIRSIADLQAARAALRDPQPATPTWRSWLGAPSCESAASSSCCKMRNAPVVRMRRAPFGLWSSLSPDEKGWVFLERFANMVKAALVPEDQAAGVAFATSEQLKAEILAGGRKLRDAAAKGQKQLNKALEEYLRQLDQKLFTAVSVDKAMNTGGVGGQQEQVSRVAAGSMSIMANAPRDKDVVAGLMRELVDYLQANWAKEQQAQRQRQLVLAVSSGDVSACRRLILAGADPNAQDSLGLTCLHSSARFRDLAVTRLLIEERADLMRQDIEGNCAAHRLGLYTQDLTVSLFELLAPTVEVLSLPNKAGVQPFSRFVAWAVTALDSQPYPPANALIEELRRKHPPLAKKRAPVNYTSAAGLAQSVQEEVQEYLILGKIMQIRVWQNPKVVPTIDVVYIGLPLYLPWSMQENAVNMLAHYACSRHAARFLLINEDVIGDDIAGLSLGDVLSHLVAVVEGLPLRAEFFLVDNTIGSCTQLLWRLQHRVKGAMVLNPNGWFSEEFFNSEAHQNMMKVVNGHIEIYRQRNIEGAMKMVGNFMFANSPEDAAEVAVDYADALRNEATEPFWSWTVQSVRLALTESTPCWQALGRLSENVTLTLVCGSFSPAMIVQETVSRIQALAPQASICYVSDSKQWWEQEGVSQVTEVARLLSGLLAAVADKPQAAG